MTEDMADGDTDDSTTVLVVDDERDLADLYRAWLSEEFDVRVAYDGNSALDELDSAVDVVLLDRRMPTLSGDDVLETIREESYDCRVAMVTAVEPDIDIVEMGFDDYLQKPVDREQLVETVNRLNRRSSYDEQMQRYFSLAKKRSLLDERLGPGERSDSEAYRELESEMAELQENLDEVAGELDDEDFATLFRQLE
ncbi:response regulator [Halanaeroarchaeum sulfurireducens]|uniref:Response regulator receiver protein n=1 Tax=Halanaeroarchaeum sulfurireducens TaxID=1604004 RepID=A0A0F7PER8_9EURY|nr:response regulator [Halanaeroarchaeum sulfurireducens]AKH97823.1 response regulator receiver protein [Halanaeroarchaeum sulfurireducens]ALG82217.1 response regulator receiver protein [Halanaeroarchaeum sulfurireducens]